MTKNPATETTETPNSSKRPTPDPRSKRYDESLAWVGGWSDATEELACSGST